MTIWHVRDDNGPLYCGGEIRPGEEVTGRMGALLLRFPKLPHDRLCEDCERVLLERCDPSRSSPA